MSNVYAICGSCDNVFSEYLKFCSNCGTKIEPYIAPKIETEKTSEPEIKKQNERQISVCCMKECQNPADALECGLSICPSCLIELQGDKTTRKPVHCEFEGCVEPLYAFNVGFKKWCCVHCHYKKKCEIVDCTNLPDVKMKGSWICKECAEIAVSKVSYLSSNPKEEFIDFGLEFEKAKTMVNNKMKNTNPYILVAGGVALSSIFSHPSLFIFFILFYMGFKIAFRLADSYQ